jgi:hypothetical protein
VKRAGRLVGAILAVSLAVWVGVLVSRGDRVLPPFASDRCTAVVDGHAVILTPEQAEHAGLIVAISVARGLPARAASIALATAYQESGLRNLDRGDRDSLGLFQQRPSQGWGTPEQVSDPTYATNAFYDALVTIPGYTSMEITVAAQAVQRSAFPTAYADHERDARALASALTGYSPAAFSCRLGSPESGEEDLTESGLTPGAEAIRAEVADLFDPPLGGFEPGGVRSGHGERSAHYQGRAVDIFVRPINAANNRRGWAIAQYLVSQAQRLGIATVIFDDRIWTAGGRSGSGWRDYAAPDTPGDRAILEHRDHVHVDVL